MADEPKSKKNWKDFLLKSSVPLEYEVKRILDSYGCITDYESGYFRADENNIVNEFSYDLDASYLYENHYFQLMIECKYRDQSTNWIFIPENYNGKDDIPTYGFLNPNDHFIKSNFFAVDYEPIAPLCAKGIEITSEGPNPKTITQAINQLNYGVVNEIINSIEEQTAKTHKTFHNTIFCTVPIIVTTSNLYRLKENISIEKIKSANAIDEVADKHDCLVITHNNSKELERYNKQKFAEMVEKLGWNLLTKRLNSFNKSAPFVLDVISKYYSPNSLLVIQLTEDKSNFKKLFDFMNETVAPTEKTFSRLEEIKKRMEKFEGKMQSLSKKNKDKL